MKLTKLSVAAVLSVGLISVSFAKQTVRFDAKHPAIPMKIDPRTPAVPRLLEPTLPMNLGPINPLTSPVDEVDSVAAQIGTTYYDYFSNGNQNRLIARDSLGGLHAVWMNARGATGGDRIVAYNYREPTGLWGNGTGSSVYSGTGAGYCNIDILRDGRAVVAAHRAGTSIGYASVIGVDDGYQIAAFVETPVPNATNPAADSIIWPVGTTDRLNKAHVFGTERSTLNANRLFYAQSNPNVTSMGEFGYHNMRTLSSGMASASARGSNRVAVAWPQTAIPTGYDDTRGWNGFLAAQVNNNLFINISNDGGATWTWDNPWNVTRFRTWNDSIFAATSDTVLAAGDTFRFYNDATMLFDNNDQLHVVFITRGMWEDATTDTSNHASPPIGGMTGSACEMWHWCESRPNQFDWVGDGWHNMTSSSTTNALSWQSSISRPTMSIDAAGNMYTTYTSYDYGDVTANGFPCGDVYVTKSTDNGQTWYYPTNITNTLGDSLAAGLAHSETFPSTPETITNDTLYVMYLDDRAGGTAVSPPSGQTLEYTLNQMIVQSVPVSAIRMDSTLMIRDSGAAPRRREMWIQHMPHVLGVKENSNSAGTVNDFRLEGNYPNPFNPTTELVFSLDKARDIKLAIYDVNGREVAQLASGRYSAGKYTASFDGKSLSSGVYFARLTSNSVSQSRKITLLK